VKKTIDYALLSPYDRLQSADAEVDGSNELPWRAEALKLRPFPFSDEKDASISIDPVLVNLSVIFLFCDFDYRRLKRAFVF